MQSSTIERRQARELRVSHWIDAEGRPQPSLKLSDLGSGYGYKVISYGQKTRTN